MQKFDDKSEEPKKSKDTPKDIPVNPPTQTSQTSDARSPIDDEVLLIEDDDQVEDTDVEDEDSELIFQ